MKVLIGMLLAGLLACAADQPKPDHIKVVELRNAKLKQENLVLRYQAMEAQKAQMQAEFTATTKEIASAEEEVYRGAKADRAKWALDLEHETFTAVVPPPTPPPAKK